MEAEIICRNRDEALYEQARRLRLLEAVATESNLDASVERVLLNTLGRICEFTDWPLAHVFVSDHVQGEPRLAVRPALAGSPSSPGLAFDGFAPHLSIRGRILC